MTSPSVALPGSEWSGVAEEQVRDQRSLALLSVLVATEVNCGLLGPIIDLSTKQRPDPYFLPPSLHFDCG